MKSPDFRHKFIRLLCTCSIAVAATVAAESPETGTTRTRVSRAKPQVIYHLPPTSNYAATLHSQAKGQNYDLPIDSSMPTSVQTAHANANAAAAEQAADVSPVHERNVKSRARSNRSQVRPHSFGKSSARGNGHGNHPHKR